MGRNLMVMIVDPDIDHRAQLKETLSGLSYAVVAEATYGVEASRLAMEMRPEVILLHAEEPYSLSLRAVELVTAAAPKATVVVLSRLEAPTLVAKAMLADAHAFVPSPPNQGDLDETIQTAYARVQRRLHPELGEETPTAGTVITVFSPRAEWERPHCGQISPLRLSAGPPLAWLCWIWIRTLAMSPSCWDCSRL